MASNERDRFGIKMLNPTLRRGRQWFSKWERGQPRTLENMDRDPEDPELEARGNGSVTIDGQGIATLTGPSPRMYVYYLNQTWCNVEVTFYGMRVSELPVRNYNRGFVAGARSEHQDASEENPYAGTAYYGRMLYDGRAVFKKEMAHHLPAGLTVNRPSENNHIDWDGHGGGVMPTNQWLGYKLVLRNVDRDSKVRLQLFLDRSDGAEGGSWEMVAQDDDAGDWAVEPFVVNCETGETQQSPRSAILLRAATSVLIRNDDLGEARYKKFSIREIDPLP
jgi:hypothetical protein